MNIKLKSAHLVAAALLVSLSGCKTLQETAEGMEYVEPEGVTLMAEAEIREMLVGNTYMGDSVNSPGSRYIEYIHEDGRISGLWNGEDRYKGQWVIYGPVWCYRYETQNGCNTLVRSGDSILWYKPDGRYEGGKALVVAGDPKTCRNNA